MKESRSIEIDFIIETTGKSEHGKTETKIHCGARQTAPEKPGTGPDACGAGDLVFGPHPHGAGFCAGPARSGRLCTTRCLACLAAAALWWARRCAIWPSCTPAAKTCCPTLQSCCWGWCLPAARSSCSQISPPMSRAATMVAACYQNGVNAWLSGRRAGRRAGRQSAAALRAPQPIWSWRRWPSAPACTFLISPRRKSAVALQRGRRRARKRRGRL